jgi:hypothetical protein
MSDEKTPEDPAVTAEQLTTIGQRAKIIAEELKKVLAECQLMKSILTAKLQSALAAQTYDEKSVELVTTRAGVDNLVYTANTLMSHLEYKDYDKNNLSLQNISLAIIGSVAFLENLDILIGLLEKQELDTEGLKSSSGTIRSQTHNIRFPT